jgi:uncharacterized protein YndB with AHSA1/START domain
VKVIRKEIVIQASPEKVWRHITDPQKIAGWFMPNDFEPRVGKSFSFECKDDTVACVVKEIVPLEKLVFTFRNNDTKIDTLVTITLTPEGAATRLTLVHSGWDTLPPDEQKITDKFDQGWGEFLRNLQSQAAD